MHTHLQSPSELAVCIHDVTRMTARHSDLMMRVVTCQLAGAAQFRERRTEPHPVSGKPPKLVNREGPAGQAEHLFVHDAG